MRTTNWCDESKGDIWWNQVSGPLAYRKRIIECIENGCSMGLESSDVDALFFELLEDEVSRMDSAFRFHTFRVSDYSEEEAFQTNFIETLAPGFIQDFESPYSRLYSEGHLQHRFIYFEIDADTDWAMQVVKECSKCSSPGNGIFLCLASDASIFEGIKQLTKICLSSYLSIYNLQYFALQCLGNFSTRSSKGLYIAQLAAKLSGSSGIVCADLATPELFADPMEICSMLPEDMVRHAIWETQIQIFLPVIEKIRRYLITKYADEIKDLLPQKDEFNHEIKEPSDMELRHLQFYGRGKYNNFFDHGDDDWFTAAYNARNDLSHLKLLDRETMDYLLDLEGALK